MRYTLSMISNKAGPKPREKKMKTKSKKDIDGQGRRLCPLCLEARLLPEDCGTAEIDAKWIDGDGVISEAPSALICRDCFDAGDPTGPGFVRVVD